jgi:hypothetical protein
MGTGAPPILRFPLILLAMASLVILGMRLWPWQQVFNLPVNGTTGIDPAVVLVGYIGLIFLIGGSRQVPSRRALSSGTMLGLLAGLILAGEVVYETRSIAATAFHPGILYVGLRSLAWLIWGIAGLRGAQLSGNAGTGALAAIWSAMVSCLMACTAVLAETFHAVPLPIAQDAWNQYEGLAIGNPATQALVHSLNLAPQFLLVGPLLGGALGALFAFFAKSE